MSLGIYTIEPEFSLDDVDRVLVSALQQDCKQSLAKLGERVSMSAPAVMERIRKLEKAGIIRGYSALVDGRRLGLDVTAFIGVSFNFPKEIGHVEAALEAMPEVLEVHHVTGGPTMMLKVKCENTAHLESVIGQLRMIEGVHRTETMIVLSTSVERVAVPMPMSPKSRRRKAR